MINCWTKWRMAEYDWSDRMSIKPPAGWNDNDSTVY